MRETLNFHLIGVGGVGMSALATLLFRLGHRVSGADRTLESANVRFLSSLGVKVFPDDGSGVDASVDEVVVSTAIEPSNPGLARARELGIKVTHRAAALAAALSSRKLVAVAGTCGKSTVTAMLGHILSECGRDPLCVNGANVPGWEGAVRFGAGEYAVAEVDESDRSLTAFRPYAAIVTNASADHYSKAEMDEVFDAFVKDVPGPVIDARGETYRPQDYNIQNASLAVRMAVALGCGRDEAERAMAGFGGVERRLQLVGRVGGTGAFVYDDYAHNPEKLRAMWLTLAERHAGGICVVWRPHGYAPLRKMLDDLAAMFGEVAREQDKLLLLPVYDAGGTACRDVNSQMLAERLAAGTVELAGGLDEAFGWCRSHGGEYEAFVTCGARDPGLPVLAGRLCES
jgi:UDP-N-acetylmuramate--alanine ligase